MDKRLAKRHKRQVARAREKVEAAKEASRPDLSRGNQPKVAASGRSFRNRLATAIGGAAKTDG
jgi:hypothetical protein